jgi:lipopolysaccharide export system permease protein
MSVLFSVLMTYGRLSTDSEIIAFKSLGLSQKTLTMPSIFVGLLMTVLSAQTYFFIGPWGQGQFSELIAKLSSTQVVSTIREGTFAEGFYDLVVYANKVNQKAGILKDVFIYDERSEKFPVTIIAREGQILNLNDETKSSVLRLFKGSIHKANLDAYTKIQFENYDIFLTASVQKKDRKKEPKAMTIREIQSEINNPDTEKNRLISLQTEYHKRWSLSFACLVFSVVGVGLGTLTNRRAAKSGGFVLSVSLIVTYWILSVTMDNFSANEYLSPSLAMWIPNVLFSVFAFYSLKSIWNK